MPRLSTSRVAGALIAAVSLRASSSVLVVGSMWLMARTMSVPDFGVVMLANSILLFGLTMSVFGGDTLVARNMSRAQAAPDGKHGSGGGRILLEAAAASVATSALVTGLSMSGAILVPVSAGALFILSLAFIASSALLRILRAIDQARGRTAEGIFWELLLPNALLFLSLIAVYLSGRRLDVFWALVLLASSFVAPSALRVVTIYPYYRTIKGKIWGASATPGRLVFGLLTGIVILQQQADLFMLGTIGTASELAFYGTASRLSLLILLGVGPIRQYYSPRIIHHWAVGNKECALQECRLMGAVSLATGILFIVFILAAGRHLMSMFGADFGEAYPVLVILSVAQLGIMGFGAGPTILSIIGYETHALRILSTTLAIGLVVGILGYAQSGINGLAFGRVVALATAGAWSWYWTRRTIGARIDAFHSPRPKKQRM